MNRLLRLVSLVLTVMTACLPAAFALEPEAYASESALASGRWVKVSVSTTGLHIITDDQLRRWGFSDPAAVTVHGYGGAPLGDVLHPDMYIDDLPQVSSERTSRGLVFYAVGPVQINMAANGTMSHTVNPYSLAGYYFLTEGRAARNIPEEAGTPADTGDDKAPQLIVHEQELTSPGNTGRLMVGEDFNYTRSRTFDFDLPGAVPDGDVTVTCSFVARTASPSTLSFRVNGTLLPLAGKDRIPSTTSDNAYYGQQIITSKTVSLQGSDKLGLELTFNPSGLVSKANLDYLRVQYLRTLSGRPDFFTRSGTVMVHGAGSPTVRVWDVTDPLAVRRMRVSAAGAWSTGLSAVVCHYVLWDDATSMPSPQLVADVPNQNLHGISPVPDMVIIAPRPYLEASRSIAALHRDYEPDPLKVEVVELETVLNEFGSGAFDPGAIRRFLKMLFDRGEAAGTPLRYALMMGKGTFDNRLLTPVGRGVSYPMPLWVSEASLQENQSYSSDDYFALLSDYDGQRPAVEKLDIAVGRIPCTTVVEAAVAAEKIRRYMYEMPSGDWQNRITVLADDENQGLHMTQSETMLANMGVAPGGSRFVVDKVYCDSYKLTNSTYPQAKRELFASFDAGTALFCFIGHGSPTALGSKIIISPTDFRTRFFLKRLPFFYAATCSFLQWDSDIKSMAEALMFQEDGGMIGCISALRPVFITNNGNLSASFGTAVGSLDADGVMLPIGDIYVKAKNGVNNDTNKMRYVLMGDPALRLVTPSARVVLDEVNGVPVSESDPATVMARQTITISGHIADPSGRVMEDFNGPVTVTLYDAEHSVTSNGYGAGSKVTFEQKGVLLFTAKGVARSGRFSVKVKMPSNIADNYRPATLNLYAAADNLNRAVGVSRDIYAFGYDDSAPIDGTGPAIDMLALNHSGFENGDNVNESPMLLARVSDNSGISLSTAGVGRAMTLIIDNGLESYSDLAHHFVLDDIQPEAGMSGSLSYRLENLSPGRHSLTMRVWDVDDNCAERTIEFNVKPGLAPEIFSVYTDAMPASTSARFYVRHDRPDVILDVRVTVYDLMGKEVWSGANRSRSNLGVSAPVEWDLCDNGGRRVQRGIYIFRAEVSADGQTYSTKSRKMAVAAPR